MPENAVFGHVGAALIHMKVRPADVGGGDADQDIGRLFDGCVVDIVDRDFAGTVINKCFHGFVSFCSHLSRMRAAVGGRFARDEQLERSQIPGDV
jgi:hypothetical protein